MAQDNDYTTPAGSVALGLGEAAAYKRAPHLRKALERIEKIRDQMGLDTPLYAGQGNQWAAYHAPDSASVLAPGLHRELLQMRLRPGGGGAGKMLEGGGVMLPTKKIKTAAEKNKGEPKKSKFKSFAKKVGLGAAATVGAVGLGAAATAGGRKAIYKTIKNPRKFKQHMGDWVHTQTDKFVRDHMHNVKKKHPGFDAESEFKSWRRTHRRNNGSWEADAGSRWNPPPPPGGSHGHHEYKPPPGGSTRPPPGGSTRPPPRPETNESSAEAQRAAYKASQRSKASAKAPSLVKKHGIGRIKTKAEFNKALREKSFKAHPDRGGSAEAMKGVNSEFSDLKDSDWYEKLSMVRFWAALAAELAR